MCATVAGTRVLRSGPLRGSHLQACPGPDNHVCTNEDIDSTGQRQALAPCRPHPVEWRVGMQHAWCGATRCCRGRCGQLGQHVDSAVRCGQLWFEPGYPSGVEASVASSMDTRSHACMFPQPNLRQRQCGSGSAPAVALCIPPLPR